MILLIAFFRNNNNYLIFSIIPIILFFLLLHLYNKPYKFELFNKMETLSLSVCLVCYYAMVFMIIVQSDSSKAIFFILIFVFNLIFVLFWGKEYYFKVFKKQATELISRLNSKLSFLKNRSHSHSSTILSPKMNRSLVKQKSCI